jgi:capsular polysaccharide biosynthesis protein
LCLRAIALAGQNRDERLLGAGLLAGLCAWAASSVFLHLVGYRNLLLIIAFITVLDLQARERHQNLVTGDGLEHQGPRRQVMSVSRLAVLTIAAVTVVVAAAAILQNTPLFEGKTRYVADTSLQVRPRGTETDYVNAYQWDTVNRRLLLPTYAGVIGNPRFRDDAEDELGLADSKAADGTTLSVVGDPADGIIRVSADSSDPNIPAPLIERVVADATRYLRTTSPQYAIAEVSSTEVRTVRERNYALLGLVGLLLLAIASLVIVNVKQMIAPSAPTRRPSTPMRRPAGPTRRRI